MYDRIKRDREKSISRKIKLAFLAAGFLVMWIILLIKSFEPTFTETHDADPRTLLTQYLINSLPTDEVSKDIFNKNKTISTITYSDDYIEMELPFSQTWGNDTYKITPYDVWSWVVDFWNIWLYGETERWNREYTMYIADQIGIGDILEWIKNDESTQWDPQIKNIGGLQVVKYLSKWVCDLPYMMVVGLRNTYIFVPSCSEDTTKDFAVFENIIRSIRLK